MTPRRTRCLTLLFALAVLLPSLYGFGAKFLELVDLCRGDMTGAFAIAPIVNYLLASAGFLLLFGWAAANGMFHDIERPKQTMLDNEARLDRKTTRNFHART
jgi:hypothetical protein